MYFFRLLFRMIIIKNKYSKDSSGLLGKVVSPKKRRAACGRMSERYQYFANSMCRRSSAPQVGHLVQGLVDHRRDEEHAHRVQHEVHLRAAGTAVLVW